jgi:hypothetical protein
MPGHLSNFWKEAGTVKGKILLIGKNFKTSGHAPSMIIDCVWSCYLVALAVIIHIITIIILGP